MGPRSDEGGSHWSSTLPFAAAYRYDVPADTRETPTERDDSYPPSMCANATPLLKPAEGRPQVVPVQEEFLLALALAVGVAVSVLGR